MKYRVKFSKHGNIRYVGHLDVMRYFQKAIRRADIPIKYSEGFSPHQIMSFSAPLGMAFESDAEYMDIELEEELPVRDLSERLGAQMCEGIEILGVSVLEDNAKPSMAVMESADFVITFEEGDYSAKVDELMASEDIPYEKESKKTGETKLLNIRPMIYDMQGGDGEIKMHLAQGSEANLSPRAIIEVLGIPFDKCTITRSEMYGPGHVPMGKYQTVR